MTRQSDILDEAVDAAMRLIRSGETSMTWVAVAEERVAPRTASDGDIASVTGLKLTIRKRLADRDFMPVPVAESYFALTAEDRELVTDEAKARRYLPIGYGKGELGMRLASSPLDPYYRAWTRLQGHTGAGRTRTYTDAIMRDAERTGELDPARDIVTDTMRRSVTVPTVRRVLGTTVGRMLRDGRPAPGVYSTETLETK